MHGAVLVKSGRVIACAPNIFKNPPKIFEVESAGDQSEQNRKIRLHCSIHAEVKVVQMAGDAAAGSTVYVARVNSEGEPRMSRPCSDCHSYLSQHGVKSVVYTNGIGYSSHAPQKRYQYNIAA